jgi:hypothetical protein
METICRMDGSEPIDSHHLPIILASGLVDHPVQIPWWEGHSLRLTTYTGPAKTPKT